jgi:hypothetical protein
MPVKVRCPGCQKVLNAPDAARGKAVKCPDCEAKVRVPEAGEGAKTAVAGKPGGKGSAKGPSRAESEEENLLSALDLSKVEDTRFTVCPKCGREIPDDARECPKCGVDPTTGRLSKAAVKRATLKGPDPAFYWKAAWADSWAFTLENMPIVLRTMMYTIGFGAAAGGCGFMVTWCEQMPPKVFWGAMGVVTSLVLPGWIWFLTEETVRATISRKANICDAKFDLFLNISLGIKMLLWVLAFAWIPLGTLMFPLAMVHFVMPVQRKAWLAPVMLPIFFRNFGPTLYYWVVAFVLNLPANIVMLLTMFFAGAAVYAAALDHTLKSLSWVPWTILGVGSLVTMCLWAFAQIFVMRVNGLIGYFFRDDLDLITFAAEKKYVRKEPKLDKFGNPIVSPVRKWATLAFALVSVYLAGNVITYYATGGANILMPYNWGVKIGVFKAAPAQQPMPQP